MEKDKFKDINIIREAWKQDLDSSVIKAATEDWEEYPPHVQAIIEDEVKNRGLWPKVIHLRGETQDASVSLEGNLEGYVCKNCKGRCLNFHTGRCVSCYFPSDDMGYCIRCDKFWSLQPGQICPEHGNKLVRHKAAMALLRFGNLIFDEIIFIMLAYASLFILVILLVFSGFVKPDSLENINTDADWLIGISLWFFYYFIFESIWQRSPAKFITGTKVITSTGAKPSVCAIAIRTLIRFVPFEPFSFLGERVCGWHDRLSGTYVIKAKRFEGKNLKHIYQTAQKESLNQYEVVEQKSEIFSSQNVGESQPVNLGYIAKCENCGRMIGKLESSFKYKGSIVCTQCFVLLSKQL